MFNKLGSRCWEFRSSWTLRPAVQQKQFFIFFEHVVTVTSTNSNVEVTARFVHSIQPRRRRPRGGLVSLVIRSRSAPNRRRRAGKIIVLGTNAKPRGQISFDKTADHASPQSRGGISSGNSSPVLAPVANPVPVVPETIKEDIVPSAPALPSPAAVLPDQTCPVTNQVELPADASSSQTQGWLRACRFHAFETTFSSFSASDILRLSRDDLIQICGLADGIRLFNALHSRAPQPKLSLYFALESPGNNNTNNAGLWRAVYLESLTSLALTVKLLAVTGLGPENLRSVVLLGPQGIHVLVTNELVANMRDESMFLVEIIKEPGIDRYKLLLKPSSH